jgi:predicted nucleotidyltransferase component of viral defense system
MIRHKPLAIRAHEDRELFREAVNFTSAETGFAARLIEKDYFCSVLLEYLAETDRSLVFKGGTCLTKVYAGFYRLSEDLDFVIPTALTASRSERSQKAAVLKQAVAQIPTSLPGFRVVEPVRGANNSTQYIGVLAFASLLRHQEDAIKIEAGLREPLLTPVEDRLAKTLLLDPIANLPMVPPVTVRTISKLEAFSEKFRAAHTRREVAIRDFYDIDYAIRHLGLSPQELIRLVEQKLAVPGNDAIDVSGKRLAALQRQLEPQLKPVLREDDLDQFDLERAFQAVTEMASRLGGQE